MELPKDVPLAQTTILTDANGDRLATLPTGENRVEVDLSQVPEVVRLAVMDTEDHDFYLHRGIDPRGVARALWSDLRGRGNLQGGSTLTQQYVKNQYAGSERTVTRKFREAILSVKLEQKYSKDEILERYLNAIYFGRGAYGVQAASKAYFGKDVQQLGLPEASYLAGLIRAPELADAYLAPDVAASRRALTLGNMTRFGDITPQQETDALAMPLKSYVIARTAQEPATVMSDKGTQYFVDYVRSILIKRYGEKQVTGGGLRVKTTLDPALQSRAYDAVYGTLKPGEPSGALVSVNDRGEIKAMVGGRDYKQSQVNLAVGTGGGGGRQAGSTFKAFELAAAVEDGVSVKQTFPAPPKIVLDQPDNKKWEVSNFNNESFGRIDLVEATVHSVNTVYAQLVQETGAQELADTAKKVGITSPLDPNDALVLGADNVTPLEMADAYMTFGARGMHVDANPILEVLTPDGKTLEKANPKHTQVINERTADTVNFALQQVVARGTGRAANIGKPLAGKTGTTEDNGDAWFVGYTPNLSTAVWMGYPEGSARKMNNVRGIAVTGGTFPAQIFRSYMTEATKNQDVPKFVDPVDFGTPPVSDRPTTTSAPTTTTTVPPTSSTTTPGLIPVVPTSRPGRTTTTTEPRANRDGTRVPDRTTRVPRPRQTVTTFDFPQ